MIDNDEIEKILHKLENLEDEELAVELLKEFNRTSAELGKLLLNQDKDLNHDEWKYLCNEAKNKLDKVVKKINEI